jgi:hypothetical protein
MVIRTFIEIPVADIAGSEAWSVLLDPRGSLKISNGDETLCLTGCGNAGQMLKTLNYWIGALREAKKEFISIPEVQDNLQMCSWLEPADFD